MVKALLRPGWGGKLPGARAPFWRIFAELRVCVFVALRTKEGMAGVPVARPYYDEHLLYHYDDRTTCHSTPGRQSKETLSTFKIYHHHTVYILHIAQHICTLYRMVEALLKRTRFYNVWISTRKAACDHCIRNLAFLQTMFRRHQKMTYVVLK